MIFHAKPKGTSSVVTVMKRVFEDSYGDSHLMKIFFDSIFDPLFSEQKSAPENRENTTFTEP